MAIDWIYLLLLCIALYKGFKRGLIIAVFSVIAIVVGISGALTLSRTLTVLLLQDHPDWARWIPMLTYIAVFMLLVWLIRLLARLIQKSAEWVALGFINRLGGAILYGFIWSFVFSGILWLGLKTQLLEEPLVSDSRVCRLLLPLAPRVFSLLGGLIPFFKSAFEGLNHVFEQINQKLPDYVGADR